MTNIDDVTKLVQEVVRVYKGQDTKLSQLYANSTMREVRDFRLYFQGYETALEEVAKYLLPDDIAMTITNGRIEEVNAQRKLLWERYQAILAERRTRRRQRREKHEEEVPDE